MKISWLLPSILLLALASGFALAACGGEEAPPPPGPPAELPADVTPVAEALAAASADGEAPARAGDAAEGDAASATAAPIPGALAATGEFVSPVRSELVAKNPGRVAEVLVDEGALVERGQPLLRLESDYPRLEVARAEAELARAQAARAEAERDFTRKRELLARNSVAQATFERSQAAFEQASAATAAAEAALALARQRLADTELRSPIGGVVAERRADPGERLGDNTVAYVLVQLSPLKLRVALPERHLAQVAVGQSVEARVDAYPGEVFRGRVVMAGKVIDPGSRTFAIEAEFDNRDRRLRPGLFARVEVLGGALPGPPAADGAPRRGESRP